MLSFKWWAFSGKKFIPVHKNKGPEKTRGRIFKISEQNHFIPF